MKGRFLLSLGLVLSGVTVGNVEALAGSMSTSRVACKEISLSVFVESSWDWVRWNPSTGKRSVGKQPVTPEGRTGLIGTYPGPRTLVRSVVSPNGDFEAFGIGVDNVLTIREGKRSVSKYFEDSSIIVGWLGNKHLVIQTESGVEPILFGRIGYRHTAKVRFSIETVIDGNIQSVWSTESLENEQIISAASQGILSVDNEPRFYYSGSFVKNKFNVRSVSVDGDEREERRQETDVYGVLGEIDGRYIKERKDTYALVDKFGSETPLTSAKVRLPIARSAVALSPGGRYALLALEDRAVIWDRRSLKRREFYFERQLTSYYKDRYDVRWVNGGVLLYGGYGAIFISSLGKISAFGPAVYENPDPTSEGIPVPVRGAQKIDRSCRNEPMFKL